jgi:hypothetical protein
MGKIIRLVTKREKDRNNLITITPWEFRWSDGGSRFFSQVPKGYAAFFEKGRVSHGRKDLTPLAGCRHLKGGLACTIQAIFLQRHNEEKMRQIYYLAGLVDCMINRRNPLLRTHHIRGLYGKVMTLKRILCLNWYGSIDQVLLPVSEAGHLVLEYPAALSRAETMKELYRIIREATDEMFDILSRDYVFYAPGR